jgi:hypothetical protein
MSKSRLASQAGSACKWLEATAMAVLAIGVLLAAGSIYLGFVVPEPWVYGPAQATEDWHSIVAGFIGAVVILVQTGIVVSVLKALDVKAEETLYANSGDTAE